MAPSGILRGRAGERGERMGTRRNTAARLPPSLTALILVAAILVAYAGIYDHPFVFDDDLTIIEAAQKGLGEILREQPTRALPALSFALNRLVLGGGLAGYHAVNVAVHVANAFLVLGLLGVLRRLRAPGLPPWTPLAGALLWALHPLQTNAVTYLSQRITSLAGLCYLGATVCYLRAREARCAGAPLASRAHGAWYLGAFLLSLLAAVAKENTATLPAALMLAEWLVVGDRTRDGFKMRAALLTPFLVAPALQSIQVFSTYLEAGSAAREATAQVGRGPTRAGNVMDVFIGVYQGWDFPTRKEYLLTEPGVLLRYLRLWLLPMNQVLDPFVAPVTRLRDPRALLPAAALAALAGAALAQARKRPLVAFGILWFFVTLAVESSVIPIADFMFEHRMLIPSVGLTLAALGLAGPAIERHSRGGAATVVVITLALCAATVARNRVWSDPILLWSDNVTKAPDKLRGWVNLSNAYLEEGRENLAEEALLRANAIFDRSAEVHANLGVLRMKRGNLGEAEASFRRAIELMPLDAEAHYNLGTLLGQTGRGAEAERELRFVMRLKKNYAAEARNNLAILYLREGRPGDAARELEAAVASRPDLFGAHHNLALAYEKLGRIEDARREEAIAERLRKTEKGG